MNYDLNFNSINTRIDNLREDYQQLMYAYKESRDFTNDFLKCCEKHGIKLVSINKITDKIESCKGWNFSTHNVFADEIDGIWPAIWGAVEEFKINGGCGNTGQHQIDNRASAKLVDGVYRLEKGKWIRLEE